VCLNSVVFVARTEVEYVAWYHSESPRRDDVIYLKFVSAGEYPAAMQHGEHSSGEQYRSEVALIMLLCACALLGAAS
jgi:hypothetical protein